MIKKLPNIYPNELFYSFLSRTYVQSGVGSSREFSKIVFENGNENPKYNFINKLNNTFKAMLSTQIELNDIITKHTIFNYYGRFLNKNKKVFAINEILEGKNAFNYLHMPATKKLEYLKYCPLCAKEDRTKYGEAFFHVEHQLDIIKICPHHWCKLKNTMIKNTSSNQTTFVPLEMCYVDENFEKIDPNSIEVKVIKYIYDFIRQPLLLNDNNEIGKLLTNKLDNKYFISVRGVQKNLNLIHEDLKQFYYGYDEFNITKRRVALTLRGLEFNTFTIILLALFESISVEELCDCNIKFIDKSEEFDCKVLKLYNEGFNFTEIAEKLKSDRRHIRNIIIGKYNKKNKLK